MTSLVADADSHRARHGERSAHARSSDAHASRSSRASERRARARGRRSRPRVAGAGGRDFGAGKPRARRRPRARLSHERGCKDDAVARQGVTATCRRTSSTRRSRRGCTKCGKKPRVLWTERIGDGRAVRDPDAAAERHRCVAHGPRDVRHASRRDDAQRAHARTENVVVARDGPRPASPRSWWSNVS